MWIFDCVAYFAACIALVVWLSGVWWERVQRSRQQEETYRRLAEYIESQPYCRVDRSFGGNSHQRRLARRQQARAAKLTGA